MTLRTRLALLVGTVVALAVVGGAYAAYISTARELRAEVDQFLVERAQRFAAAPRAGIDQLTASTRPPRLGEGVPPLVELDSVIQVIDAAGTVVAAVGL